MKEEIIFGDKPGAWWVGDKEATLDYALSQLKEGVELGKYTITKVLDKNKFEVVDGYGEKTELTITGINQLA
jgi:hypothetical protein